MRTTETLELRGSLGAYGRGVLGALVMAVALGTAVALSDVAHARYGVDGFPRLLLAGVVCTGLAVPWIAWIRRRLDRRSLSGLGLPGLRRSLGTFGLGALVTTGAAAVTFGLGAAAGWIAFGELAAGPLAVFLASNTLIAFLYEALPEELTLRGYAYRSLSSGLSRWTAALWTTVLFLLVPAGASVVQAGATAVLGGEVRAPRLAPGGQDPVAYLVLLTFFGTTLVVARVVTGSVWASIGVHLAFLTVNRIVLSSPAAGTGWSASFTMPDAVLLIPAYLFLAALGFLIYGRWRRRGIGWRDRDPEPLP